MIYTPMVWIHVATSEVKSLNPLFIQVMVEKSRSRSFVAKNQNFSFLINVWFNNVKQVIHTIGLWRLDKFLVNVWEHSVQVTCLNNFQIFRINYVTQKFQKKGLLFRDLPIDYEKGLTKNPMTGETEQSMNFHDDFHQLSGEL